MDPVSFRTTLTAADWRAYVKALAARAPRHDGPREVGALVVLWGAVAARAQP